MNKQRGTKRAWETDAAAGEVAVEQDENAGVDLNAVLSDEGNENINIDLNAVPSLRIKKKLKHQQNVKKNPADERFIDGKNSEAVPRMEIVLPKGTPITNIAGVEFDSDVVGAAIQFYEFCRAFAEVVQGENA